MTVPRVVHGIDGLLAVDGQPLGLSDWLVVNQDRINAFADATGDHQWIHVDVEQAAAASPFGGTIAHGFLTLSLTPTLVAQVLQVEGFSRGINYGVNRVRFPSPVPVDSAVRLALTISDVQPISGGVQYTLSSTFEVRGSTKPCCVAENVIRRYV